MANKTVDLVDEKAMKLKLSSYLKNKREFGYHRHGMMPPSEDESWNMFRKKVGEEQQVWPLDSTSWSQVFSSVQNSIKVLSLCYNDLTQNLKVCLLYSVLLTFQ
ncbi:hypothetical protein L6452_08622 [Arctium lappa]|uniref:Uncharacterized protein n=1 Tax=Arctium lappa TaxID=4217 RepID=A0ACB9DHQ4_ARCLA|nr:hypothetical protein L6452_08622 [Arctium lappa]